MQFIEQGNKRNCGHIAVAALTDQPLDKVTAIINRRGGTSTKMLIKALRALGFCCEDKMRHARYINSANAYGLAQLHDPSRSGWHWVAIGGGMVYDGLRSGPMFIADYVAYQAKAYNARITSFLPVEVA
jgi:hypothetical protein